MTITHAALAAWSKTVPPHSIYWIPDELWHEVWDVLARDARLHTEPPMWKFPLISIRSFHENVRLGRRSALNEYRRLKYPPL